ncbi:unnamed protein product [Polarella glacialis]|uniref:glutathione transferase n=1 Tax=Polarella glacialis TaxID=89957 RepID=A0A813M6G4_POLGL|nr:unnamed protein product [Polarella glacialis]
MAVAALLGPPSRGAADECGVRAVLRGEQLGPVNGERLRRALRRARAAAEVESKAVATAWREPSPSLGDVEAWAARLPPWVSAAGRQAAQLSEDVDALVSLSETYDAQVVVALSEGRALERAPILSLLERLERIAVLQRSWVPRIRAARAALDSLDCPGGQAHGFNLTLPDLDPYAGPGTSASSSDTGLVSKWSPLDVKFEDQKDCRDGQSVRLHRPCGLPATVIRRVEPGGGPGWRLWLAECLRGAALEAEELGQELSQAVGRAAGLRPGSEAPLGEACAPWDVALKHPSPWLAVMEVLASGVLRCWQGIGRLAPTTLGRLLRVPRLKTGYWKIRGFGAPARMMCTYAGVDCEDIQYEARMTSTGGWSSAEWEGVDKPALSETNVFVQLPYVVNCTTGEVISQFSAVYLYLGLVLGLNGLTSRACACNEQVLFYVYNMWMELRDLVYPFKQNQDRASFKASLKPYFDTALSGHYEKLESWLQQQGTGYFVSWKPCTADFLVWEMLDQQEEMARATGFQSPMTHFELLTEFHRSVRTWPRLQAYFDSDDARLPINNKMAYFRLITLHSSGPEFSQSSALRLGRAAQVGNANVGSVLTSSDLDSAATMTSSTHQGGDEKEKKTEVKKKKTVPAADKARGGLAVEVEKAKLTQQAIEEIRKGASKIGAQKIGAPFIPENWSLRYKNALGPYKTFLKLHDDKFILVTDDNGDFVVRLPGQLEPPAIPDKKVWQKELVKAWMEYCKAIPRPQRDFGVFMAALPKVASRLPSVPGSPAMSAAMSPRLVPQSSPLLAPGSPRRSPRLAAAAAVSATPVASKGKKRNKASSEPGALL